MSQYTTSPVSCHPAPYSGLIHSEYLDTWQGTPDPLDWVSPKAFHPDFNDCVQDLSRALGVEITFSTAWNALRPYARYLVGKRDSLLAYTSDLVGGRIDVYAGATPGSDAVCAVFDGCTYLVVSGPDECMINIDEMFTGGLANIRGSTVKGGHSLEQTLFCQICEHSRTAVLRLMEEHLEKTTPQPTMQYCPQLELF